MTAHTRRVYLKRKAIASLPNVTPIGSTEPVSKTLPRAVRRIARELNPEKIILFGSYANGQPTPDSDVDLLVVMNTSILNQTQRSWLVSQCLVPRPFPVDIIVRTPEELSAFLERKHFFTRKLCHKARSSMNVRNDLPDWIEKAEEDFDEARFALRRKKVSKYIVCFHAQQCAEKYLKALLIEKMQTFPKTHDLKSLHELCEQAGILVAISSTDLHSLSTYAVRVRYPGDPVLLEEAQDAFKIAKTIRKFARQYLNLK